MDNAFVSSIDNHNVANGDPSWFSRRVDATGTLVSDMGDAIQYGLPGAVVSGALSLANSGIAIAKFLGADTELYDTHKVMRDLDSDLGKYYEQHEAGVDVAGFVLTSFIPGTAGLKAMQAAKAGFIGTNMARSSGLMTSLTADYAKAAKIEYATGKSGFSVLESNTVKALAQGLGSQTLDMAAFNTAVMSTMFKSPVLDDQSIGDLFWNDLKESLLFGTVGGVFSGIKTIYGIKKAGKLADRELFPYKNIPEVPDTADSTLKLLNYYKAKFDMPEAMLAEDIGPLGKGIARSELDPAMRLSIVTKARTDTLTRLDELIRGEFNEFAGNDTAIGQQFFDMFSKAEKFDDVAWTLLKSQGASRISKSESLAYGDVIFPTHNLPQKDFIERTVKGEWDNFFTPKAAIGAKGYRVTGNLSEMKVAGAKMGINGPGIEGKDEAFAKGYDMFRNANGSFSINPTSKILSESVERRAGNNLVIDLETGNVVDKAIPTLADLASKGRPVTVTKNTVLAGEIDPIKIVPNDVKWNPKNGSTQDTQARYIWAQEQKPAWSSMVIGEFDFPLLERLYQEGEIPTGPAIKLSTGENVIAPKGEALRGFIENRKALVAKEMNGTPNEELALRLNTSVKYLEGTGGDWRTIQKGFDYTKPKYAKVQYAENLEIHPMMNPNNHEAALEYANQVQLIVQRNNQTFANFAREMNEIFPDAPNWKDPGRTPTREGAGSSLFGFANANYGTAGGWAQGVAPMVDRLKLARQKETAEILNTAIGQLRGSSNASEALAEAALVNNQLLRSEHSWVMHPTDPMMIIPRKDFQNILAGKMEAEEKVLFKYPEAMNLWKAHIDRNSNRQVHTANLKGNAGIGDDFDPNVFYPIPIDTTKLKHFAFVEPRAPVTLADKKRVIAAKDEATLQKLIDQVDQNEFRIYTKQQSEDWHKAIGDYDFSLGLNESAVDSSLKKKGVLSQHFPTIDEGYLDRMLEWHSRQEEILTHSMVYHKYSQAFEELRHLGKEYTNVATSQFRSLTEKLERSVMDPYNDIVKTALNISRASEYQPWINFNNFVRDSIEKPINKLRDLFAKTEKTGIDQNFVNSVSQLSRDMGQGNPYQTASQVMIANGNIPNKPWLQPAIAKAQSILSTTLLQWDTLNAVNNTVSSVILVAPEVKYLMKGIQEANPEVAGKLAGLLKVTSPDGSGIQLPTLGRLLQNAHGNFLARNETTSTLLQRYRDINAVTDISLEMRQAVEHLTWDYKTLTSSQAETGIQKAAEFGRKWTGNKLAEEYNRFISADIMRQITDHGISAGVLNGEKEANEFIQLFVNRTQGNYLYSQRPIVFQGVVGQAVSLFQTYQFNLMQQLFRYVGEGESKSLAMLAGLQGGIYGMQGLPAFNFLNTHIVGNATGNTNHRDLYFASYSTFGKSLGDWIMYGAGSNALGLVDPGMRVNLYSRGDINPRQLTVLPTQLSDIPIVSASTRFVGNLFGAAEKLDKGGALWPTMSQALEHNGLSRPLSGLASIAQGYTTTNQSSLLTASQDFWNIGMLSRVVGGKPFDEAVALDALYRINAYRAKDLANIRELGSAIKTTAVGGREPTSEQVTDFAKEYAKSGGKIDSFNRFFTNTMMSANRSQVNKIAENLNNPQAKGMQVIMGGQPLPDFLHTP